jgi:hypothetical protein
MQFVDFMHSFATVEHWCIILLTLHDHDHPIHRNATEYQAHCINRCMIGLFFLTTPIQRPDARAAASITRTISSARLRVGSFIDLYPS